MEKGKVHTILKKIRQTNPLIYNVGAVYDACFTANGLLALGASPIMDSAAEEAGELASKSDSVILNFAVTDRQGADKITSAGKSAMLNKIPLIMDAAGAGISSYKNQLFQQLLNELSVSIIRGNTFEIAQLIGEKPGDFEHNCKSSHRAINDLALLAAKKLSAIIVITGKEQIISDGISTYVVQNGEGFLSRVFGSCFLQSAIIGSCAAVEGNLLEAAVSAMIINGVAAEISANKTEGLGPGNFQIEFINQLSLLSSSEIDLYSSFSKLKN